MPYAKFELHGAFVMHALANLTRRKVEREVADLIDKDLRRYVIPEGTKRLRHAGPGEEHRWGLMIDDESATLTSGREHFSDVYAAIGDEDTAGVDAGELRRMLTQRSTRAVIRRIQQAIARGGNRDDPFDGAEALLTDLRRQLSAAAYDQ